MLTNTVPPRAFSWRGLIHLTSSNIGANVLGFASGILMARILGPEGRGEYQTAALIWAVVPGLLTLSLGTSLSIQPVMPRPSWLVRQAALFTVAGATLVGMLAVLGMIPLWMAVILILTAVGYMSSDLMQGVLRRQEHYGKLAAYRWFDVGGGALAIGVLAVSGALTTRTAVAALCLSTVAAVVFALFASRRASREKPWGHFEWHGVANIHLGTVVRVLSSWTDQLVIAATLGTASLGLYAIGNSVAVQFLILPSAINTVLLRHAHASSERGLIALKAFIGALFWSALACSLLLALAGPWVFGLVFGPAFAESGRVAALLVLASLFAGLLLISETFLIAQGGAAFAAKARLTALPALALSAVVLVFAPNMFVAAAIPISANLVPLLVVLRRIAHASDSSFSSFFAFPRPGAFRALLDRRKQSKGTNELGSN